MSQDKYNDDIDLENFMLDEKGEGYEDEEVNELKDIGSQLEEVPSDYYNLGDKKAALRKSPSPIVFEQVAKAPPRAKAVKTAVKPMSKANPPQQSRKKYYDDDDDVKQRSNKSKEAEKEKDAMYDKAVMDFWLLLRKNALASKSKKGGTRKRNKRSTKKRSTRRNKRSRKSKKRRR
jgi:hypothetical protein